VLSELKVPNRENFDPELFYTYKSYLGRCLRNCTNKLLILNVETGIFHCFKYLLSVRRNFLGSC
jgi:hypothetical protein